VAVMKIKIRNTQPKVGWVCLGWLLSSMVRWSGGEVSRSQWAVQGVPWLGSPLLPSPLGGSNWWVARSDCLSLSCHVKMVLRKCIFCIPSANEQHRYKTTWG